jgi:hypothetical protein
MEHKQLFHNSIKDMSKRKVRHVNIGFLQLRLSKSKNLKVNYWRGKIT